MSFSTISVHQPSRSNFQAWCFTVQGSRLIPAASDISASNGPHWKLHNWSKITQGKIVTHRRKQNLTGSPLDRAVLQRLRLTFPALFLLHAQLHVEQSFLSGKVFSWFLILHRFPSMKWTWKGDYTFSKVQKNVTRGGKTPGSHTECQN